MLLLLNTTKTMNLNAPVLSGLNVTEPCMLERAQLLSGKISRISLSQLAELMSLSDKLAIETSANISLWGMDDRPKIPALFGFTGILYKSLDAVNLEKDQLNDAQKRVRILSGLYGLLCPLDLIEAYRFEMGLKLVIGKTRNIAQFWKETLTAKLNEDLKINESIVCLASHEYMKALDVKKLNGPVISPIFREQRANGTYRTVVVHSKRARGELVRYALVNKAKSPQDLMEFNAMGWKAATEAPEEGAWLFTRPVSS